jgi:uncharacterized protein
VDTWGWAALEDSKDPLHKAAAKCYEQYSSGSGRVLTSNFVLDETFTLLFRRRPYDEAWRFATGLMQSQLICVEVVTEPRFLRAFDLRKKFSDKPRISFTDLTSMAIMTEMKVTDILTADAHFVQVGLGFRLSPS